MLIKGTLKKTLILEKTYKLKIIVSYKLFSDENKVTEYCLKLEKWQGPPHMNIMKQYETVFMAE